jgi:hypothetical protein
MQKAPIQRDPKSSRTQTYTGTKPLLTVSEARKIANDFEHTKNVMDFFIESTYFQDQYTSNKGNYRDLYILYDAYNNIIPDEYFHYVTNPLNSTREEHRAFPARIRPYSIIRPNVDLLLGEYDNRPKNYTVVVTDSEAINQMEEGLYQSILANLESIFIGKLQENNVETGQDQQQPEAPPKVKDKFVSNYKDERAIWAQVSLDRIHADLQVDEQLARMFKDYVIAGETYSYKGIRNGQAVYERVSPIDIDYDKSPDNEYVEDGAWVVRRKFMLPSDIVAQHYNELTKDQINHIEDQDATLPFTSSYFNSLYGSSRGGSEDMRRSKVPVYHVAFKYYKKINFLTFIDEMGEEQEIEVPENYKPDKALGESMESIWVTTYWEGHRVDAPNLGSSPDAGAQSESIYLGIQEIPYQRNVMNDFSACKGPFNGIRFSDVHSRNTSIVELGMPYQILYIILHYRLELTIAKSKGKIALLDINAIPKHDDWDEEKFFYWGEANGFGLLDRNQLGVDKGWNQYQVLDLSLYEHITNLISVMDYIKVEWDALIGFTPQRKGNVQASETASGIDAARYQSSVVSERLFTKFDEFIRSEREGLLDLTKFQNLDGRQMIHYDDTMKAMMVNIDGPKYKETEYDVHVNDSRKEQENLRLMKDQAANFASQGGKPSIVAEVIQAENISKLKTVLKSMEREEMEQAQANEANQGAQEQKMMEIEQQYKQIEFEFDQLLQEHKYAAEERIEHIRGQYKLAENDFFPEANEMISPQEVEKSLQDRENTLSKERIEQAKVKIQADKVKNDKEIANKKIDAEKYKADISLKVAKENKNQHDVKSKSTKK